MDRGGYLRWREELKKFHARLVTDFMAKEGYPESDIEHARRIILKKNFQADAEAQTIEDALCLVFLETQFEELHQKTPDPKMIDILQKTWRKMSAKAKDIALTMKLPAEHTHLILEALKTQK